MISICPNCGSTKGNKEVPKNENQIYCPDCGHRWPFKKMPLFVLTGASGVGKTSILQELMQNETKYICMEQDIVYFLPHNTPEEASFKREVIMGMAKNISQIGIPVVIGAASLPEQFENTHTRRFFSEIYYMALVCEPMALEIRMRDGRKIDDADWIESSVDFNNWFIENGEKQNPKIEICDITGKTVKEVATIVDKWVLSKLHT